jgi:hypothetical protein
VVRRESNSRQHTVIVILYRKRSGFLVPANSLDGIAPLETVRLGSSRCRRGLCQHFPLASAGMRLWRGRFKIEGSAR